MLKRFIIIAVIGAAIFIALAPPASAEGEVWSFGGGFFTMPNLSVEGVSDSGFYASGIMRSQSYFIELDYAIDGTFLLVAADYLYPLSEAVGSGSGQSMFGGSAYIGAGYTYFTSDDIGNEKGFNVVLGADLGDALFGAVRYDFLGSDQEMLTFGITYALN